MKRIFTLLAAILLAVATITPASAQAKGEWNIKGGIGWVSTPDFVGALIAGLGSIDTTEGTSHKELTTLLNPNVEILYGVNDKWAWGCSLSAGYILSQSVFDDTGVVNKSASAFYPTLCLAAQTTYFRRGQFAMYGSWGFGVMAMVIEQKGTDVTADGPNIAFAPMGNVYPLSFSYGGRTGGFAEIGWGAKGIVNLGIYHNF
ncbi:MAG: hypothetical protein E7134_02975 [Rikenellaceae bacterium]|nr:hypothetical protein [Rikenellaceae bacterium]